MSTITIDLITSLVSPKLINFFKAKRREKIPVAMPTNEYGIRSRHLLGVRTKTDCCVYIRLALKS